MLGFLGVLLVRIRGTPAPPEDSFKSSMLQIPACNALI